MTGAPRGASGGRAPRRPARRCTAVLVAALAVALLALALLTPLTDPRPDAGPDPAFWTLPTGSRLAHVDLPAVGTARPTPVVVLHGGPGVPDLVGDAAFFGPLLTGLGHDVHLYEQLGSGRSSRLVDPTGYGLDRDVADLEQVRLALGAERMVLVGHSYGGTLAAHYLAAHPDRVERLVLSAPGPLDPADRSAARATAGLGPTDRLRTWLPALAPRALLGYTLLQVDPGTAHAYLPDTEADARNDTILSAAEPGLHCRPDQVRGPVHGSGFYALQYPQSATATPPRDVRAVLAGVPVPVLVLKGSCDYLSWRAGTGYRDLLPHTTLVYLPGAGHSTYQDRPAEAAAAIRAFLTGAPLPSRVGDDPPPDYTGPA